MCAKSAGGRGSGTGKEKKVGRDQALERALAQIEKQYGKGAVMKLGGENRLDVSAISTGSISLDLALGCGGVPRGRVIEIFGPESSGKTTLSLQIIASAQKTGGICAFVALTAGAPDASVVSGCEVWHLHPLGHLLGAGVWAERYLVSVQHVP